MRSHLLLLASRLLVAAEVAEALQDGLPGLRVQLRLQPVEDPPQGLPLGPPAVLDEALHGVVPELVVDELPQQSPLRPALADDRSVERRALLLQGHGVVAG